MPARDELMAGDGAGSPFVVQRPLAQKASDRGVDIVGRVAATPQPVLELKFGQFAPGEQRQARGVGGPGTIVQTW